MSFLVKTKKVEFFLITVLFSWTDDLKIFVWFMTHEKRKEELGQTWNRTLGLRCRATGIQISGRWCIVQIELLPLLEHKLNYATMLYCYAIIISHHILRTNCENLQYIILLLNYILLYRIIIKYILLINRAVCLLFPTY